MPCLTEEIVLGLLERTLPPAARADALAHVAGCADCRQWLAHATRSIEAEAPAAGPPAAADRYVELEAIGAGSMGIVYRARDTVLGRLVALKVLWQLGQDAQGARLLQGLQQEAEAMARLQHPNVVAIFDAGVYRQHVFLSMELVEGQTLAAWLETPRPWREVLEAFAQAGRGLGAAHAAGLVHHDFTPRNVMRGHDGRVRVTDFGFARAATEPGGSSGTPAYLAPEKWRGASADARSDQFSFGVALFEALYGQRPFSGATLPELERAVLAGAVMTPGDRRGVPAAVHRVVVRALAADPAARWPSMTQLLEALEAARRAPRRRVLAIGAGLGLCALALGGQWLAAGRVPAGCERVGARLHRVWGPERRAALERAFVDTGASFARDAATRAAERLDRHAAQWRERIGAACAADGDASDRRGLELDCLEERLGELGAVTRVLERADRAVVERAIDLVEGLAPVDSCADANVLRRRGKPPEKLRVQVEALRGRLADARARAAVGRYADGLSIAREVFAEARAAGYLPAEAEALEVRGELEAALGDLKAAEASLQEAAASGAASQHDDVAARAWTALASSVGVKRDSAEPGLQWARYARAAIDRLGGPERLEADRALAVGRVLRAHGRAAEVLVELGRARVLYARAIGPGSSAVAEALLGMSSLHEAEGAHARAVETAEQALAIQEQALGPEHPALVGHLGHLGILLATEGDYREATQRYRRALAIGERALGKQHLSLAPIHSELGQALGRLGRHEEGLSELEAARVMTERALGAEHADVAAVLDNLGSLRLAMGQPAEALVLHGRALAIFERTVGARHPRAGRCHHHLAAALVAEGRHADALAHATRALAILEAAYGREARDAAVALTLAGEAHLGLGDARAALPLLERALELRRRRHASPSSIAQTSFALARALWASGGDRVRARALAEEARKGHAASRRSEAGAERARVEKWIGER